jgi:hypothetical protein
MSNFLSKGLNDLKGTASELFENRNYDELVDKVGEAGALRAIRQNLEQRGLSEEQWRTYRKVRTVMHQKPLGVKKLLCEIEELTNKCIE